MLQLSLTLLMMLYAVSSAIYHDIAFDNKVCRVCVSRTDEIRFQSNKNHKWVELFDSSCSSDTQSHFVHPEAPAKITFNTTKYT